MVVVFKVKQLTEELVKFFQRRIYEKLDEYSETKIGAINIGRNFDELWKKHPTHSAKIITDMVIDKIKKSKTCQVLELFSNSYEFRFCDRFIRAFPKSYSIFAMPHVTIDLQELASFPFVTAKHYLFAVNDFAEMNTEDVELLSPDDREILHKYIDWLGFRNAIGIDRWKRVLRDDSWPFLRTMSINGRMNDLNIVELAKMAPGLFMARIASDQTLSLERFRYFPHLCSLTVCSRVRVALPNDSWKKASEWTLKELELRDCSEINSFYFLGKLRKVTVLHLFASDRLDTTGKLDSLFEECHMNLGTLNLSYTSAITDDLLMSLVTHEVILSALRVNCGPTTPGFTDVGLIAYLECQYSFNLKVLELCGHRQLTQRIFDCTPLCISSLAELDVRETQCYGTDHREVLKKVFQFGLLSSSQGSGKKSKWKWTVKPDYTAPVLNVHFTYQATVEKFIQGFPVGGSDSNDKKRIFVRYWKKTTSDTSLPKPSALVGMHGSSSTPALSTNIGQGFDLPGGDLKTQMMRFNIRQKRLRWDKFSVDSSSASPMSNVSANFSSIVGSQISHEGEQNSAAQVSGAASSSSSAASRGAVGLDSPSLSLTSNPGFKAIPGTQTSSSSDVAAGNQRVKRSALFAPRDTFRKHKPLCRTRSTGLSAVERCAGPSSVSLAVDVDESRLLFSSLFAPIESQTAATDSQVPQRDVASSSTSIQSPDLSSLGATSVVDRSLSYKNFLGPKELCGSRVSLYAFPRTAMGSVASSESFQDEKSQDGTSDAAVISKPELEREDSSSSESNESEGDADQTAHPEDAEDMEHSIFDPSEAESKAEEMPECDLGASQQNVEGASSSRDIGLGVLMQQGLPDAPVGANVQPVLAAVGAQGSPSPLMASLSLAMPPQADPQLAPSSGLASPPSKIPRTKPGEASPCAFLVAGSSTGSQQTAPVPKGSSLSALASKSEGYKENMMMLDRYYPKDMFSAPGSVAVHSVIGVSTAVAVPTEAPDGVSWELVVGKVLSQ
jgi:hypothetical protein